MYTAIKLQINAQISFLVVLNCLLFFFCFSNRSVCTKKGVHLRYGGITGGGVFLVCAFRFFILYLGIIPRQNSLNCFFVFTFFYSSIKVKSINSDK